MDLSIARKLLWLVSFFFTAASSAANEVVRLVADEWCPFTCAYTQAPQGIGVDIARKIFEDRGYQVTYHTATWDEAKRMVSEGEADILIGTVRAETPDLLFPDYHFSYSQSCFFSPSDSIWSYQGLKSLRPKRVGVISGYSYGAGLDAYMDKALELGMAKTYASTEQLFAALKRGDVDVFIGDQKVSEYYGRQFHASLAYRVTGCQPRRKLFFAVSPVDRQKGNKLIKILNGNLLIGLRGGGVKAIHQQYGFPSY
ncbi:transporter substrate-binding domain-containing protein [Dasania sp. GY-MA-18]|uniref:Transporter substrate-binding domain-containing protein n=1 Tax=Dasania phycosphaerae TaxID=2950436 RepID=A0A9J6RLP4_9GAMM|nr:MULTISPECIES: transporter substrate-binding domain-containing protein [Dasania]MCR8922867.1 transporter substrate-binding domain-containing protein [Dasania sp. GY-MA-18]MCZ0865298.1 transporter substrate-binding domain-containing protein [Dasania phycosphaerae]MCZ0869023.1 transporter substrate-binding domain-containing protein [Dasania phycosphaerae]